MKVTHLSKRLQTVADLVDQLSPQVDLLADIGSDHAYLPVHLLQAGSVQRAIAGEVSLGPYQSAQRNVETYNLEDRIQVRLGDGLSILSEDDPVEVITICGMGGQLIRNILDQGWEELNQTPALVLQPNLASHLVRDWLSNHKYKITDEMIVEEKGHLYEIILAQVSSEVITLSAAERLMGPCLMVEYSTHFLHKWHDERQHREQILAQLDPSQSAHQDRIKQLEFELRLINQVIGE